MNALHLVLFTRMQYYYILIRNLIRSNAVKNEKSTSGFLHNLKLKGKTPTEPCVK